MKLQKLNLSGIVIVSFFLMAMAGCSQPEPEPPHVHTFSNDWTLDDTAHWHAATCGHSEEVKGEELHKFPENWTIITSATEESDGLEEGFCDVCNYHTTRVILQLNHNHDIAKAWTADSTKHWHTASCGKVEHNEDVGMHVSDAGTVTSIPSCTTTGVKTYRCTVCSDIVRTEEIPAKGHTEDAGTVTTPATCVTKGVKTFKCSVCKAILRTEEIPATGHTTASGKITKVPTYTSKGEVTYECTICRTVLRTEIQLYKFHDEPVKLPSGTNGTAGISATYVEFGDWPQSVLPITSTVTVDESIFVEMGANTYYLGSDGNYYAKCAEKAYSTSEYHDGTQVGSFGWTVRYFKVEPIKWRILTDNYSGKKLLLAENILTANVPYYKYYRSSNTRTVGLDTNIYPNNYKYSQIRAYLNGLDYYYDTSSTETTKKTDYTGKGFLQTAFTQNAQGLIAETVVDNSKETTGYNERTYAADYACENTTDKIFLLSESEVHNRDYGFVGFRSNARIRFPTDYAKANYAHASSTDGYGGYWWLRSPYYIFRDYASDVDHTGYDNDNNSVYESSNGVVPALSISF